MSTSALLAPPRTWSQKLLWLLGCGLFFVLVYFGHRSASRPVEVESPVDQAVRDADAASPGWQHDDLEAAREAVPDDENSAPLIQRASARLPPNWYPQLRSGYYSSRPHALSAGERAMLAEDLNGCGPALAEALRLADRPRGRHPFVPGDRPRAPLLPHIDQVTRVTTLLRLETIRRTEAGDRDGAARACVAALNAARSLGDEPNLVSQLTRKFHDAGAACRSVQFLVNHAEVDAATLSDLQRRLEEEQRHPGFLIGMRGYRAELHLLLEAVADGKVPLQSVVPASESPADLLWHPPPSVEEVRLRHAELLPVLTHVVGVAREPPPRRAALLHDLVSEMDPESFRLLGPLVRDLPTYERQFTTPEATVLCTIAALAAERYRRDHGEWPDSLEALAPDYLDAVPADPADGRPLRYQRFAEGVVVYSLCRDRLGTQYDPNGPETMRGVWVRLWDASERGRPSPEPPPDWPRPPGRPGRPGGPPGPMGLPIGRPIPLGPRP